MRAVQRGKIIRISLIVFLLMSGCAGAPKAPPLPVLPLVPTASRLIIFRPSAFVSSGRDPAITINGVGSCPLTNGTGFATDVAPGLINIAASTSGPGAFGTAKLSLTVSAGQTYYIEFQPNDGAMFSLSLLGELLSGAQTGAFNILLSNAAWMGKIKPVGC
jgi:hypothetical protein